MKQAWFGKDAEALTSAYFLSQTDIERLVERYADMRQPALSYGTVRDYCDSVDAIGALAQYNRDLKDLQRCWTLKAILGHIPQGGRILEIGAGQPFVADALARAGYEVTVVDPYEGHGNGPTTGEQFKREFPRLTILSELFTDALPDLEPGSFDCCYSISVLEHLPLDSLPGLFSGIRRYAKPGAVSIHSVDHVLLGHGADYHLRMLELIAAGFGLDRPTLDAALANASADPETYFLSAEAHNLWRGSTPYADFPMRRCISVQVCNEVVR